MSIVHASCVEFMGSGLLICGKPGSGKSDLCLRLIDAGARLIADDQTQLNNTDGKLIASCPDSLRGLLEIRGIGIVEMPFAVQTEIGLKLILRKAEKIDRMPLIETEVLEGVQVPVFQLNPFEASALLKIKTYLLIQKGQRKVIS